MKASTSTLQRIGHGLRRWRRPSWAAYRRYLQRSKRPILVGPWRSELGFEALYWIPFVQSLGIPPERLIPITRGGSGVWYGTTRSVELYSLREPKAVRIENLVQQRQTGLLKQVRMTAFDRAVLRDAAAALGLTRYHVLHPAWMYQTLAPYWDGQTGLDWLWPRLLQRHVTEGQVNLSLAPIPAPTVEWTQPLPHPFVAVRFYLRSTFPHSEASVMIARETIKTLAAQSPVILLNADVHADEHMDLDVKDLPNVFRLSDVATVTPQNNLAIQSAVLGKAQGFVGTYGGLSQLALRMGKPSMAFYQEWNGTALAHKYLADAISTQMRVPCWVIRMDDIPLIRSVLPRVVRA